MNIAVITGAPFYIGLAPTNRIIAYCKGLVEAGHTAEVICLYPTEEFPAVANTKNEGQYLGIAFHYASGTCIRPKLKLKAWLYKQKGLFNTFRYLHRSHKQHPYDAILITTYSTAAIFTAKALSRIIKVPLILEKGEYPKFIRNRKRFSISRYFNESFIFSLFDGYLVITDALKDYFSKHSRADVPIHVLPMCVDVERFSLQPAPVKEKHIVYCGSLDNQKDGIDYLVVAFASLAEEYEDWSLTIYGGSASQVDALRQKIRNMGLENRVNLTGWVDSRRIPELLLKSSILVMPRPDSVQAAGGFPTKLGEYLATGRPVIATIVGEIPQYLKDGQNAFLVRPADSDDLAQAMRRAIDNPDIAEQVGLNGQQLTRTTFSYKTISRQIVEFVQLFSVCEEKD